jgi:hypothetical protein
MMIKDDDRISSQHDVSPQHTKTTRGSSTCPVEEDKVGMSYQEPPLQLPDSNLDRSTTRIRRTRSRVVPRESSIQESLWSDYSSDSSSSASSTSFSERRRRRRRQLRLLQEERFVLQKEQFEVQRMFQIMIEINNFSLEANRNDNNSNNDDNVSTLSSLSGYETDDDYSTSDDGASTVVECDEIIEIKELCTAVVDL